jgi:hypothetical protein
VLCWSMAKARTAVLHSAPASQCGHYAQAAFVPPGFVALGDMATALARAGCQEGMSHCLPAVAAQVCRIYLWNAHGSSPMTLMNPGKLRRRPSSLMSCSTNFRYWLCSCCFDIFQVMLHCC